MLLCSVQMTFMSCLSVRRRRIPPLAPPEVSYFPCLGVFEFFFTRFEGLKAKDVTLVQFVKTQ